MKYLKILFYIIIAFSIVSLIYIQLNLVEGSVDKIQPHQYKGEILKKISIKDMFYTPLWVLLGSTTLYYSYKIFNLMFSKQSYYNVSLFVFMLVIVFIGAVNLFNAYSNLAVAQYETGRTGEYIFSAFFIAKPFVFSYFILGIIKIIKNYNEKNRVVDDIDYRRFTVLKSILKNK